MSLPTSWYTLFILNLHFRARPAAERKTLTCKAPQRAVIWLVLHTHWWRVCKWLWGHRGPFSLMNCCRRKHFNRVGWIHKEKTQEEQQGGRERGRRNRNSPSRRRSQGTEAENVQVQTGATQFTPTGIEHCHLRLEIQILKCLSLFSIICLDFCEDPYAVSVCILTFAILSLSVMSKFSVLYLGGALIAVEWRLEQTSCCSSGCCKG